MITPEVCCAEESFFLFKLISEFSAWIVYDLLGLMPLDKLARFLRFAFTNGLKTTFIISTMIYLIGLFRARLKPSDVQRFLHKKPSWISYFAGAFLGIITPFCSCSAVPIFIAFTTAGIPIGVTISFLIASPLVTESGVILTTEALGWGFTGMTIVSAVVVGVLGGILFEKTDTFITPILKRRSDDEPVTLPSSSVKTIRDRHRYAVGELKRIGKRVAPWLAVSIVAAALFTVFLPPAYVEETLTKKQWFAVPLAVIVGIPLYGTSGTIIPVASVLLEKGASAGTILAFILSVNGASLPAFMMLKPLFTIKGLGLLFLYFLTAFIITGSVVNFIV